MKRTLIRATGRTLGVVPRQLAPSGYIDLELDDFVEGTPCDKMQKMASMIQYSFIANT